MATYHLHAKTHSRGVGKGAGGHVRYITRQGPYAEKTIEQADGSAITKTRISRDDEVLYTESGNMPDWVQSPADYWDAADQYERANGTVYREIEFALPMELSDMANIALAQDFAKKLSIVPDGVTPYTLAIHRSEKDPSLIHCHLMLSDKINDGITRDPGLWFRRAASASPKNKNPVDPAKGGAKKTQARISHEWLGEVVRPLWTELANQSLDRAGFESVRIDHRTLDAQRKEAEQQAEQARALGDLVAYKKATEKAASLDHPPQPKRGRVLEHAGPEKAPRQVAKIIKFNLEKEARQVARAEMDRMEAEVESARQAIDTAKAAEAQQAKALETAAIMGKWMQAHPLQAKVQRLFLGKLPWLTPDGLPRKALKNRDTWTAADAWLVGRQDEKWQAPTMDADNTHQFSYAAEIIRKERAEFDRKVAQQDRKSAQHELRKRVANIQKNAEEQGHRAVVTGMTPDQIAADAAYQQLVADIGGDADFAELAQAAYMDGKARAVQEAGEKLARYTVAVVETKTEITTITATPDPDPAPTPDPDPAVYSGHRMR